MNNSHISHMASTHMEETAPLPIPPLARGINGETIVTQIMNPSAPYACGPLVLRYLYADGTVDPASKLNWNNPFIEIELSGNLIEDSKNLEPLEPALVKDEKPVDDTASKEELEAEFERMGLKAQWDNPQSRKLQIVDMIYREWSHLRAAYPSKERPDHKYVLALYEYYDTRIAEKTD